MRLLVILWLSITTIASAQTSFSGYAIEKHTRKPIEDILIQYGSSQLDFVYSDSNGKFTIPAIHNILIYFQGIGYRKRSILASELKEEANVELELDPIELNAVEITAVDANKLLERAYSNTQNRLLLYQAINQQLHFIQSAHKECYKQEVHLNYTSVLENTKRKNGKLPYKLYLIDLNHIGDTSVNSYFVSYEYHPSRILYKKGFGPKETITSHSMNDSSLIITTNTKQEHGSLDVTYYINSKDTVINFINTEYTGSALEKSAYKKYKKINWALKKLTGQIQFKDFAGKLYMYTIIFTSQIHCIYPSGEEDDITTYVNVESGSIGVNKQQGKKLDGYSNELFNIPNTSDVKFW